MQADSSHRQRYTHMRDGIEMFLAEGGPEPAGFGSGEVRNFFSILALVTLFQYVEGYTDRQAAEAVHTRPDWKEALRLPGSYPGFEALWLCRLRQFVLAAEAGRAYLQELVERSAAAGLFSPEPVPAPQAVHILTALCRFNRLFDLTEAMLLSIEALAAEGSVFLESLSLHHLYESYARIYRFLPLVRTSVEAVNLAIQVEADIVSLLGGVEAAEGGMLKDLPEICTLRRVWERQYDRAEAVEPGKPSAIWRPVDCSHCSLKAGGGIRS